MDEDHASTLIIMRFITLLMVLVFFCITANAQQPQWYTQVREILPLQSNYQDVIRAFDLSKVATDPDLFHRDIWGIDVEEGSVHIFLKQGERCVDGSTIGPGWNVPHGTVGWISFSPNWKKPISLEQLPFPVVDFEWEDNNQVLYSSEQGIAVETESNRLVHRVLFGPRDSMSF